MNDGRDDAKDKKRDQEGDEGAERDPSTEREACIVIVKSHAYIL
jgi:hypothetical protein